MCAAGKQVRGRQLWLQAWGHRRLRVQLLTPGPLTCSTAAACALMSGARRGPVCARFCTSAGAGHTTARMRSMPVWRGLAQALLAPTAAAMLGEAVTG